MISAGNDVVDLNKINKERTNQLNFYSKILSKPEQSLFYNQNTGLPFENYVWLLWSVKESAYKFLKRLQPDLVFSPTKIIVEKVEPSAIHPATVFKKVINEITDGPLEYEGVVTCGQYYFHFRSKINDDMITSVVDDEESFENVWWGTGFTENTSYNYQSQAAKKFLLSKLNNLLSGDLHIEKGPFGYPLIMRNNGSVNIPVSLAHDGHFVAYSIKLNPFGQIA